MFKPADEQGDDQQQENNNEGRFPSNFSNSRRSTNSHFKFTQILMEHHQNTPSPHNKRSPNIAFELSFRRNSTKLLFPFYQCPLDFYFLRRILHQKPQPKKITPLLSYTYFFYCSFITFRIRPFIHFKRTKIMNENVVKEMSKLCLKNPTTLFSSSNPKSIRVWWVLCGSISSGNKCLFYMCST